jgi:hypothetical protein
MSAVRKLRGPKCLINFTFIIESEFSADGRTEQTFAGGILLSFSVVNWKPNAII